MGVGAKDSPFESNARSIWVRWVLLRLGIAMVVVGYWVGLGIKNDPAWLLFSQLDVCAGVDCGCWVLI